MPFFLFAIFLFFSLSAHAEPRTAFSLIGDAKYPNGFQHYDFVNPAAPKGGTVTYGVIGTFDSLQPWLIRGQPAANLNLMYDTLMARSPDEPFTLYPLIAKQVDWQPERRILQFDLDPRARFHDGQAITADDVIFSFEQLKTHGRPNTRRMYKLATCVTKLNDLSVQFELQDNYDPELPMILAMMTIVPEHFWHNKDFSRTLLSPPVGSGPYRIQSLEPGRRITYERVKDYWAKDLPVNVGLYNFDSVRYDYYRDDSVALQAFQSGGFDVRRELVASKWQNLPTNGQGKNGAIKKLELTDGKPEGFRAFTFNTRRDSFKDRRVRQALQLAFDFEWINKTLYRGAYTRTASVYPKSFLAAKAEPSADELKLLQPFHEQLPPEVFGPAWQPPHSDGSGPAGMRANLRRAEKLLNDAGYDLVKGRLLNRATQKPFTFEILLNDPADEKLALEYGRALKRLGIAAGIRTIDSAQYTGRIASYDFDMIIYKWISTLSPGSEQLVYWGSEAARANGSRNYAGIQSPAIDAIAKSLTAAKSYDELLTSAHALDRILMHGAYFIPLYYQPTDWIAYYPARVMPTPRIPLYGSLFEAWYSTTAKDQP